MKFPSFFRFGSQFLAFLAADRVAVVLTYSFSLSIAVHVSFPLNEGAVCISEQEFNAARNQTLLSLGLVDHDAQLLAQIEAYEAQEVTALVH